MSKPSIPSGTRDFGPVAAQRRKYIFNSIESVFVSHGFQPIETPAMENLTTLTGKYGDEGDQLIFKILNSADYLSKADPEALDQKDSRKLLPSIAEKALRYDLTVPFARFVVMNRSQISMPFKRYQIQPVWRADRPQKGRYREFFQCDVDIIGSNSLANEAELIQIFDEVFNKLNMDVDILINHRGILEGFFQNACEKAHWEALPERFATFTMLLDKLEKLGAEKVREEFYKNDFPVAFVNEMSDILTSPKALIDVTKVKEVIGNTLSGAKAIQELETLLFYLNIHANPLKKSHLILDLSLARGLSYYTGCIFEVKTRDGGSSICGGGRYDNLTGIFGVEGLSGVGISFGADRIYDYLEQQQLFPQNQKNSAQVLFCCFEEAALPLAFKLASELRSTNMSAEVYPGCPKMSKQLDYANAKQISYAVFIGSEELESGVFSVKDLRTGTQEKVGKLEFESFFK